ncbi:hypothetical protein [Nonomuraea sp. SYSU D8015]|uniref:hypothetical protein n=1 Tax=Nonomuraea sp. SYSU D8015 TaxID=2593644 RepID=UPI0016614EC1|nr:hypothetical protein [Nonomuraea sp. SYSU D8015]
MNRPLIAGLAAAAALTLSACGSNDACYTDTGASGDGGVEIEFDINHRPTATRYVPVRPTQAQPKVVTPPKVQTQPKIVTPPKVEPPKPQVKVGK